MFQDLSKKVQCNQKDYYFDVRKSSQGDVYIKMTFDEKRNGEEKRNTILIFEDNFDKVFPVLVETFKYANQNRKKNNTSEEV
jgi:hypothetical protein